MFSQVKKQKEPLVTPEALKEQQDKEWELKHFKEAKLVGEQMRALASQQATISAKTKPECLQVSYRDPNIGLVSKEEVSNKLTKYYYDGKIMAYREKKINECEFVEIDFHTNMLNLEKTMHEHQPSSLTKTQTKKIDKNSAFRWKKEISQFEKKFITLLTRGSMRRFDYDYRRYE